MFYKTIVLRNIYAVLSVQKARYIYRTKDSVQAAAAVGNVERDLPSAAKRSDAAAH